MEVVAVLSGCSARKDLSKVLVPAKSRYQGLGHNYIQQGVASSRLYGNPRWSIISAKFGLVSPEQPIPNYDETFQDKSVEDIQTQGDVLRIAHFTNRFLNEGPQFVNIVALGRAYYLSARFSQHIRYEVPTVCVYQGENPSFLAPKIPNCVPFKVSLNWVRALKCNRVSLNSRVGQLLTFIASVSQKPDAIRTAAFESCDSRLLLLRKGLRWYERHVEQHRTSKLPKPSRG